MSDTRKTFCAIGAQVLDATRNPCTVALVVKAIELDDLDPLDHARHTAIDFSKRPGQCAWDDVEIDDVGVYMDGKPIPRGPYDLAKDTMNILTVGPVLPRDPMRGGIYLRRERFEDERRKFDPGGDRWPGVTGSKPYEFMSVCYDADGGQPMRRYHGFRARVLAVKAPFVQLEVRLVSSLRKTVWIDLSDRDDCDDPARCDPRDGAPAIGPESKPGDEGQVFLALARCAQLRILGPKQPPGGAQ